MMVSSTALNQQIAVLIQQDLQAIGVKMTIQVVEFSKLMASLLVYGLSNLAHGSPVDMYISPEMTAEDLAALEESMGLNQPVYVQYIKWLGQLFQGNMGYSYRTKGAVLTFQQVGNFIRQTRNSMLEVFEEDYVTMARAKGLNERQVIFGHVMRNALIPIVTAVGMSVPFLIGGAVLVEKIFSWPGLGSLMVQSINYKDYPTIMGITVFISITVLVCNILVDIIYGILDPRIRYR